MPPTPKELQARTTALLDNMNEVTAGLILLPMQLMDVLTLHHAAVAKAPPPEPTPAPAVAEQWKRFEEVAALLGYDLEFNDESGVYWNGATQGAWNLYQHLFPLELDVEAERVKFERHVKDRCPSAAMDRSLSGYTSPTWDIAWDAWQARAALALPPHTETAGTTPAE